MDRTRSRRNNTRRASAVPDIGAHRQVGEVVWDATVEERIKDIFTLFDQDGSGTVDRDEYEGLLKLLSGLMERRAFLFHRFDMDQNESLDRSEFVQGIKACVETYPHMRLDVILATLEKGPMSQTSKRTIAKKQTKKLQAEKNEENSKPVSVEVPEVPVVGEAAEKVGEVGEVTKVGEMLHSSHDREDVDELGNLAELQKGGRALEGREPQLPFKSPNVPQELGAKYILKALLGSGSFGKVYLAQHLEEGARYACKSVDLTNGGDQLVEMVRSEIKIQLKVDHIHIVKIREVFEDPSAFWIMMECLEGGDLEEHIKRSGKMSEGAAQVAFNQICDAMGHLHNVMKIVHRDLKPQNVLLASKPGGRDDDELVCKLSDFGLSTSYASTTLMKMYCGTPAYFAPELVKTTGYTRAVDCWALGVTLFYLLSAALPFGVDAKTRQDLEAEILAGFSSKKHFAAEEWEEISEPAKGLIGKLIKMNALDRLTCLEAAESPWAHGKRGKDDVDRHVGVMEMLHRSSKQRSRITSQR